MVVGGMHGKLLRSVPVLDDPAVLESVELIGWVAIGGHPLSPSTRLRSPG